MIRTLVIDDDFRVAHIHAASLARVAGYECVGEAHSAAQARAMIADLRPDLLLLDVYLPDEDGLSLLASLRAGSGHRPDCIVITAARDAETIRSSMQLGAVYYLVKPFGFAQLRDQLLQYQRWRSELAAVAEADQDAVDSLYGLLRETAVLSATRRRLGPTGRAVLDAVAAADGPISAAEVSAIVGVSRATAQRHLAELERRRVLDVELEYQSTGRPINRYVPHLS